MDVTLPSLSLTLWGGEGGGQNLLHGEVHETPQTKKGCSYASLNAQQYFIATATDVRRSWPGSQRAITQFRRISVLDVKARYSSVMAAKPNVQDMC